MFNHKVAWIVVFLLVLCIPAFCGLVIFHVGMMSSPTPCTPATAWSFLETCVAGTYGLMSFAWGGIMIVIPVIAFLIGKIIKTKW